MSDDAPVRDVAELLTDLASDDPVRRARSARLFGHMIDPPERVLDALRQSTGDPDPMVRSMACDALGRHGARAAGALGVLATGLSDRVVPVRFWAAAAIERLVESGVPLDQTTRAALQMAAADEDPRSRAARAVARRALARAGPDGGGEG